MVFSSIHGTQIDLDRTSEVGAKHLRDFLEFAEKGETASNASQLTVRDRDQLRHSVLKGLGWRITRIWSVDWALDRTRAENALLALLK